MDDRRQTITEYVEAMITPSSVSQVHPAMEPKVLRICAPTYASSSTANT